MNVIVLCLSFGLQATIGIDFLSKTMYLEDRTVSCLKLYQFHIYLCRESVQPAVYMIVVYIKAGCAILYAYVLYHFLTYYIPSRHLRMASSEIWWSETGVEQENCLCVLFIVMCITLL